MENIFFKYGILIVGAVVITMMISFAFSALNKTVNVDTEVEDLLEGNSFQVVDKISDYCTDCLKEKVTKDCFVMTIKIEDNVDLCQEDFPEDIMVEECLPWSSVIRIANEGGACVLTAVTDETPVTSECLSCDDEICCNSKTLTNNCYWESTDMKCIPKECAKQCTEFGVDQTSEQCCILLDWRCEWIGGTRCDDI